MEVFLCREDGTSSLDGNHREASAVIGSVQTPKYSRGFLIRSCLGNVVVLGKITRSYRGVSGLLVSVAEVTPICTWGLRDIDWYIPRSQLPM